jgi:uncharacterized protein YcbK (DUF882 family)
MDNAPDRGRRRFLTLLGAAALSSTFAAPALATPRAPSRRSLAFHHVHTGEKLDVVYWADGKYQAGAMRHINWLLRDYRTDEVHAIDRRLLDLLARMRRQLHSNEPIMVVSAYRSPQTNAMLEATTEGVAHHSYHMKGQAIDFCVPGRSLSSVRRLALSMKAGGVGYYPHSHFVHVDVGPVRMWRG